MKKLIAAALSVLLGALGYTVVDKALEERVATLESGYSELCDSISEYHNDSSTISNLTDDIYSVGFSLIESQSSKHKFLLQKFENGYIRYIPYDALNGDGTTLALPTDIETLGKPENYFLYITNSQAVISNYVEFNDSVTYYDKEYSLLSSVSYKHKTTVTVIYEGYVDSSFAGKSIDFDTNIVYDEYGLFQKVSSTNNTINEDGTFFFSQSYSFDSLPLFTVNSLNYNINSIKII